MLEELNKIKKTMNEKIINNDSVPEELRSCIAQQSRAIEKMLIKDLFEKDFNKTREAYEGVRRFLISKKSDHELMYDFKNAQLIYKIITSMPNPYKVRFRADGE